MCSVLTTPIEEQPNRQQQQLFTPPKSLQYYSSSPQDLWTHGKDSSEKTRGRGQRATGRASSSRANCGLTGLFFFPWAFEKRGHRFLCRSCYHLQFYLFLALCFVFQHLVFADFIVNSFISCFRRNQTKIIFICKKISFLYKNGF